MIKYKPNCAVCKTIKAHPKGKKLSERIYQSTHFNPSGIESLLKIQQSHSEDFGYDSLKNHVKRHQFISQRDFDQKRAELIMKSQEDKVVEKMVKHEDVRNKIMLKGMEKLDAGEMPISANNMISAARDQGNWEAKKADQQLQLLEMVFLYASEEALNAPGLEDYGEIPPGTSPNLVEGTAQPHPVHQRAVGDAAPPRPS